MIFDVFYKSHCIESFRKFYGEKYSHFLTDEVCRQCENLFEAVEGGYTNTMQLHQENALKNKNFLKFVFSNTVCLWCLRRHPEQHHSCGHAICEPCLMAYGVLVPKTEFCFENTCLFDDGGRVVAHIKPPTAGVRMLGIDGGGARGVTPLEFLGELQKLLGKCQIHEMIDLALGTSSGMLRGRKAGIITDFLGGLTVLAKFHQQWPVTKCANVFETMARLCFASSTSVIGRLKSIFHYVTTDAIYDERLLEKALQETLKDGPLFGYAPGTTPGTKVAVTATSNGNTRSILANYNGIHRPSQGYKTIRPSNIEEESLLWQA